MKLPKPLLTSLLVSFYLATTITTASAGQILIPFIGNPDPELLYSDDFSNPNSGWPTLDTPDLSQRYVDGEYEILLKAPGGTLVFLEQRFANYSFQADVRQVSPEAGENYGLIFGYTDTLQGPDLLEFWIDTHNDDEAFTVQRALPSMTIFYQDSQPIPVEFHSTPASNRLRVDHQDGKFTVYINGNEVGRGAINNPYPQQPGPAGIGFDVGAGSDDVPAAFRFDNVEVRRLR